MKKVLVAMIIAGTLLYFGLAGIMKSAGNGGLVGKYYQDRLELAK
jgi:hypothetical protein